MLHLNLSVPNCAVQEHNPHEEVLNDIIQYDWKIEDGYLVSGHSHGLGIDLNEEVAVAHSYDRAEMPHLRREDGSVQDW